MNAARTPEFYRARVVELAARLDCPTEYQNIQAAALELMPISQLRRLSSHAIGEWAKDSATLRGAR